MIIDNIANSNLYYGLGKRLETALRHLAENDLAQIAPGDYDVDGKAIHMLVRHYQSKPKSDCKWEGHRKYIDVHYIADGIEQFGYANVRQMKQVGDYDEKKDRFTFQGEGFFFTVSKGVFIITYPEDIHMPCVAPAIPAPVRKIVIKVLMAG